MTSHCIPELASLFFQYNLMTVEMYLGLSTPAVMKSHISPNLFRSRLFLAFITAMKHVVMLDFLSAPLRGHPYITLSRIGGGGG